LPEKEKVEIAELGYDPWNATGLVTRLQGAGNHLRPDPPGFTTLTAPSKALETLVAKQLLRHGGHPVLSLCAANHRSPRSMRPENIKPSKAKSTGRIDGIVGARDRAGARHRPGAGRPAALAAHRQAARARIHARNDHNRAAERHRGAETGHFLHRSRPLRCRRRPRNAMIRISGEGRTFGGSGKTVRLAGCGRAKARARLGRGAAGLGMARKQHTKDLGQRFRAELKRGVAGPGWALPGQAGPAG